jgi:flavin reductase (DIM6/NTAB) family NADH-FMN oxidoreductase RutF
MPADRSAFIHGMRQLAAGVTLVTTRSGKRRAGLTATAVCSVSADPPLLLICVNRQADAHDLIAASGVFAVNVLSAAQRALADRFSGAHGLFGAERFEAGTWVELATGAPVLGECLASFDCVLQGSVPAATHSVFLGGVEAVAVRAGLQPLIYAEGDYGLVAPLEA